MATKLEHKLFSFVFASRQGAAGAVGPKGFQGDRGRKVRELFKQIVKEQILLFMYFVEIVTLEY